MSMDFEFRDLGLNPSFANYTMSVRQAVFSEPQFFLYEVVIIKLAS